MNCTKPSAPYLFILVVTFGIALVNMPEKSKKSIDQTRAQTKNEMNENLRPNVAELNLYEHE